MRTEKDLKNLDRCPEDWVKVDYETFYAEKFFNGCVYRLTIIAYSSNKSVKFWIAVSSGRKRKDLDIFEDKETKSFGGLKALMWLKNKMYEFPKFYNDHYSFEANKKQYFQIRWADSRRREIYRRLIKEGFRFIRDGHRKILMKKISC